MEVIHRLLGNSYRCFWKIFEKYLKNERKKNKKQTKTNRKNFMTNLITMQAYSESYKISKMDHFAKNCY